jgi:hypothetical protein
MSPRAKTEIIILLGTLAATLLILFRMLLPGYILTLDMVWTPEMHAHWSTENFNNSFPILLLIQGLTLIIPSWVVQKIMLFALFFSLFYLPYRFLPVRDFLEGGESEARLAQIFGAAVFALNPFVYSRMLAGQWSVLFGYALLPVLFATLLHLIRLPSFKTAGKFAGALFVIGLFSIHFLYIGLVISGVWVLAASVRRATPTLLVLRAFGVALLLFALASSFWLVPAFLRANPIETRFDNEHFKAFAATGNAEIPVFLNVAALGGFWGEGEAWRYYFVWPQENTLFWITFCLLVLLILFGLQQTYRKREHRQLLILLVCSGVAAYLFALGAADTPMQAINLSIYEHIPLAAGLRDGHKIVGVLGFVYALFAAIGCYEAVRCVRIRYPSYTPIAAAAFFLVPIVFGMYQWGGFRGQLRPVWFPEEWFEAKAILDASPPEAKILVLPWHGYFSLDFANQLVVANPAGRFFGADRVIASKNAEIGTVYDQETNTTYRTIDEAIRSYGDTVQNLEQTLQANNIRYVFIVRNAIGSVARIRDESLRSYTNETFGDEEILGGDEIFNSLSGPILIDGRLQVKHVAATATPTSLP